MHRFASRKGIEKMELTSPEKLLTKGELLAILQISRTTLYRYEQKGLPSVQILRRKRYQLEAVENWLEAKKMNPILKAKSMMMPYRNYGRFPERRCIVYARRVCRMKKMQEESFMT